MKIVLPGDKIADKTVSMENAIIENGKTYATVIGMLDEEKGSFIPLESVWYPRQGDFVIGIVENSKNNVYTINLDSAFRGLILPPPRPRFGGGRGRFGDRGGRFGDREGGGRDFGDRGGGRDFGGRGGGMEERQETYQIGDIVSVFVKEVKKEADQIILILERPRKLSGGKLIEARPSKIPRIIGKTNTMLRQLEEGTKSTILVGLNGLIWVKGGDVALAHKAINKIQEEAHIGGLTERITEMFKTSGS